jgi:2-polyprenyl-3-methyl-5-hydroxy-6-metoxy-1,4-benzoquinol methylase
MTTKVSDVEQLAAPDIQLEHVACPRCSQDDSEQVYAARDYIYGLPGEYFAARCRSCGLWFQNPRPVAEYLADLYTKSYTPHRSIDSSPEPVPDLLQIRSCDSQPPIGSTRIAAVPLQLSSGPSAQRLTSRFIRKVTGPIRRQEWVRQAWKGWRQGHLIHGLGYRHLEGQSLFERVAARLGSRLSYRARWQACCDLLPNFRPGGILLEIGCGNGGYLRRLRELGWRNLKGVELVPRAAAAARSLGFEVQEASVEEALKMYPDQHFDVIVSSMVMEHLLNPFETAKLIANKLKPGGELLFSTVIRDSLDGYMFGPYGVSYDFPRHMVFFRKNDLNQMLEKRFDVIRSCHQSTPIDFQRPARLRGAPVDAYIGRFFHSAVGLWLVRWLAQFKLMGRVSYRCRRTYC